MSCSDVCLYSDTDCTASFYHDRVVRARKPHRCCECRETIPAGASYHIATGKWDDVIETYRTCLVCHEIRRAFYCHGWTFTLLWEDVADQMFAERRMSLGCLDRLQTAAAKETLLARWRAHEGLDT